MHVFYATGSCECGEWNRDDLKNHQGPETAWKLETSEEILVFVLDEKETKQLLELLKELESNPSDEEDLSNENWYILYQIFGTFAEAIHEPLDQLEQMIIEGGYYDETASYPFT